MRRTTKNILYLSFALIFFMIISCEKEDYKKAWGIAEIYMPQAAIISGGLNSDYPVPWSSGNGIVNYTIDSSDHENKINVILGVYRSGLQPLEGYTVKVDADVDTTNQIVSDGTVKDAVLLPSDLYTLPEQISVPDGKREATFNLTIDRAKLITEYPGYYGKKLLLTVGISDASRYRLNESLCKTVVIIDTKTFMPKPPVDTSAAISIDRKGNYLDLTAGGSMVIASASAFDISEGGSFSISFKIKSEGTKSWSNVIYRIDGNNVGYQLLYMSSHALQFEMHGTAGEYLGSNESQDVMDGQWHHIVIVYNGQDKTDCIYVDGIKDYAGAGTNGAFSSLESTADLIIGDKTGNNHFDGYIDDLRFWKKALNKMEVFADAANVELSSDKDDLIAGWNFESKNGTKVSDVTSTFEGDLKGDAKISQ